MELEFSKGGVTEDEFEMTDDVELGEGELKTKFPVEDGFWRLLTSSDEAAEEATEAEAESFGCLLKEIVNISIIQSYA